MWFVILALLIVAAYFVYDAFRDKRLADSGNSMSTAQRLPSAADTSAAANYKSVTGTATAAASTPSEIADNEANADSTPGTTTGTTTGTTAGTKTATTGASVAAGMSASGAAVSKRQTGSGKLQFLEAPIGAKDDLTRIDGIGPIIEGELNSLGIYHYHQIGNFSDSDVESVNAELDFPGRIERESWIAQARNLMTDANVIGSGGGQSTGVAAVVATGLAGTAAVAGAAAGAGSAATGASAASSNDDDVDDDDFTLSEADLTGAWNTDVMIEVQERLKVLNTRESDAPRLNISREDYRALKDDDDERFSRDELLKILDRLRSLET